MSSTSRDSSSLAICNGTANRKSPCGYCNRNGNGSNGAGSVLVDAIAAIIFFFFWMMQFWLNIGTCAFYSLKHLYNADRSTQIAVGCVFLILAGSILVHGVFGSSCCSKSKSSCGSKPAESCGSKSAGSCGNKSAGSCGSKSAGSCGSKSAGSVAGCGSSDKATSKTCSKPSASAQKPADPPKPKCAPKPPPEILKVKLKDAASCAKKQLELEKTFHLTIRDEKNRKLFETKAAFKLPGAGEKPPLILTTDPIVLSEY